MSMGGNRFRVGQKKGTPLRNPRNRGGSPMGEREPPILATRKMKKMMMCTVFFLCWLMEMRGRMRIMAVPVVPMTLARSVPMRRKRVLVRGDACLLYCMWTPPAQV